MKDLTQCVVTPKVKTEGFESFGVATHRASTIVFENAAAYASRGQRGHDGYSYGLYGTPTTRTLEASSLLWSKGHGPFSCRPDKQRMRSASCRSCKPATKC